MEDHWEEKQQQQQHWAHPPPHPQWSSGAAAMAGRVVRSAAGKKDRHSKVCTARGLRDRRVRLAAHTAIRFYDVQDRLGYDRPSKAVDWLLRNAKAAIDELPAAARPGAGAAADAGGGPFLPAALDSDAIAETIRSFFPAASSSGDAFHGGTPADLLSRTSSGGGGGHLASDLRLALQLDHHQQWHHCLFPQQQQQQQTAAVGFAAGWPPEQYTVTPDDSGDQDGGGIWFDGHNAAASMPATFVSSLDATGEVFAGGGYRLPKPDEDHSSCSHWAASSSRR